MAGITRIKITDKVSGAGAYRFKDAELRQPSSNAIYRAVFDKIGCGLEDGYDTIECRGDDIAAAYDRLLGIDVLLRFKNGMTATLQEKFLFTKFKTVTIEHYNNPSTNNEGDWFHLKANYYFVGYDRTKSNTFQEWILLDWGQVQRSTLQGAIKWRDNYNQRDGARATFKFVDFSDIPQSCIIYKKAMK